MRPAYAGTMAQQICDLEIKPQCWQMLQALVGMTARRFRSFLYEALDCLILFEKIESIRVSVAFVC